MFFIVIGTTISVAPKFTDTPSTLTDGLSGIKSISATNKLVSGENGTCNATNKNCVFTLDALSSASIKFDMSVTDNANNTKTETLTVSVSPDFSDVSAALDPLYAYASERRNTAMLGRGICFNKYTGSRGKGGCNDAQPEFIAKIRRIMDEDGVNYQTGELGKVDQGGGGTIAYVLANLNMHVIDAGVAVLSMHAPMEVVSKVDVYEAYLAYKTFLNKA